MAGVKGRSGGQRAGAGRKAKPPVKYDTPPGDMLEFLQKVALGQIEASPIQVRAAVAAVQYTHTRRSDGGKKEEKDRKAEAAAAKFAPSAPPKLVAVK